MSDMTNNSANTLRDRILANDEEWRIIQHAIEHDRRRYERKRFEEERARLKYVEERLQREENEFHAKEKERIRNIADLRQKKTAWRREDARRAEAAMRIYEEGKGTQGERCDEAEARYLRTCRRIDLERRSREGGLRQLPKWGCYKDGTVWTERSEDGDT